MASKDNISANNRRKPGDSGYQSAESENPVPTQGPREGRGTPIKEERITLKMTPPDSTLAQTTTVSIQSSHASTLGHTYVQNNAYRSGAVVNRADDSEKQGKRRDFFGGNSATGQGSSVVNGPMNTEEMKAFFGRK